MLKRHLLIIIDMILAVILFVIFFLELTQTISWWGVPPEFFGIITILLPAIITIVSISLSLNKEKIFGVTILDLTQLQGPLHYSFLHMVSLTIIMFGLFTVFSFFKANISIILLICLSWIYCIIFSIQKIPLLTQNRQVIESLIRKKYTILSKSESLFAEKDRDTLNRLLCNILFTEGISSLYEVLNKQNQKTDEGIINNLLDIQNRFFEKTQENIEIIQNHHHDSFDGIDLQDAITTGYDNVQTVLTEKQFKAQFYHLTRSIFALHSICKASKYEEKEKTQLRNLISSLTMSNHEIVKSKYLPFLVCMTFTTLADGEVWFVRSLRDGVFSPVMLFNPKENPFGLFISIVIAFLNNCNDIPGEKQKNFDAFLKEAPENINSSGINWIELATHMISFSNSSLIITMLPTLLSIYRSIKATYYIRNNENHIYCIQPTFGPEHIINAWLEIICFSIYDFDTENDLNNVFSQLSDEDKGLLVKVLSAEWIVDEKFNDKYKLKYFDKMFTRDATPYITYTAKSIMDYLIKFRHNWLLTKQASSLEADDMDFEKEKEKFKRKFSDFKNGNPFDTSNHLSAENMTKKFFPLLVETNHTSKLLEIFLKQFITSIKLGIQKTISDKTDAEVVSNHELNNDQIRKIVALGPNLRSKFSDYLTNNELEKINMKVSLDESGILPPDMYCKLEALTVHVEFDSENTFKRDLTDSEVDKIIDDNYQYLNGFYRYKTITNDESSTLLLTRDELRANITKKYIFIVISFFEQIDVDPTMCLRFEYQNSASYDDCLEHP